MKILTTSTSPQDLIVIPRTSSPYTDLVLTLTNENTKVSTAYNVTADYLYGYMTISNAFTLTEGTFYTFKIEDNGDLIFRGKIFCTDQTEFDKFTVNDGEFTEPSATDNEFKYI